MCLEERCYKFLDLTANVRDLKAPVLNGCLTYFSCHRRRAKSESRTV